MDQPPHNNLTQQQHEPGSQSGLPQNADPLSPTSIPQNGAIDTGLAKRLCAELIAIRRQNAALQQQLAEKNETIEKMSSGDLQSLLAAVKDNAGLKRQLADMTERHQRLMAEHHQLKNQGPQQAAQHELDYLRARVRQLDTELRQLKAFLSSAIERPGQFPRPQGHLAQVPSQPSPPSRGQPIHQQPPYFPVYPGDQPQHQQQGPLPQQWALIPQRQPTSQMGAVPPPLPEQRQQHGSWPEKRPLPQPLRIDTNRTFYPSASGPWPWQGPASASPTLGRHYVPSPRSGTLVPAVWAPPAQSPVRAKRQHPTPTTSHLAAQVIDLTLDETGPTAVPHPAKRRRTDPDIRFPAAPEPQNARPDPAPAPPATELRPASDEPPMDQPAATGEPVADEDMPKKEWEDKPVIMAFLEQAFSSCDDGNPSQKRCYFCSERHVEDPEAWPAESISVLDSPTTGQMVEHIKHIHTVVWEEVVQMRGDSPADNDGE